jgi:hypothetical protein
MHRRVGHAHLGKHLFGRHAPVHQPDPARLAVLSFDMLEKRPQRRLVRGVAGEHLIGLSATTERDRGFADSPLEQAGFEL